MSYGSSQMCEAPSIETLFLLHASFRALYAHERLIKSGIQERHFLLLFTRKGGGSSKRYGIFKF